MRRKKKRRYKFLNVLIVIIVFISVVNIGYSYFSYVLNIGGQVTGKMIEQNYTVMQGSDPNLSINIYKVNSWQQGTAYYYQYSLQITNNGQSTINSLKIILQFASSINSVSISNYDYTLSGKTFTIISNQNAILSNQTITVDFIISSTSANQNLKTVKLEVTDNNQIVTLEQFNVNFNITNSWDSYTYQYDVTVTNKTGSKINGWQLDITLPEGTSYVNGGNAIFSSNNNILTIKNETYNGKINNNSSTTFSLQLSTDIINFIPSNIKITVR